MTIEDLLKQLQEESQSSIDNVGNTLPNNKETWRRLGERDHFSELVFSSPDEKQSFLSEWARDNPYNCI